MSGTGLTACGRFGQSSSLLTATDADGDGRGDGVAAFFLPFPLPFTDVLFCFVLPFTMMWILPDHWTVCN